MTKLASDLADINGEAAPTRRGPPNKCNPVYGDGDMEDFAAIESLRNRGYTWAQVQVIVDEKLGVKAPINHESFRYHWRRKCFCWRDGERV